MADKPVVPEIIIIKQPLLQSIVSDAVTFAMGLALLGVGIAAGSSAMQWVGAISFFLCALAQGKRLLKDNRFTITQARAKLDEMEAGR